MGVAVDCKGQPVTAQAARQAGGAFIICCGLLYCRGQGEADLLCVPDGGGLRRRILQECHDTPLGGHFGRHKTAALVRRLAYWPGQTRMWTPVSAPARSASAPRRSTRAPEAYCTHSRSLHAGGGLSGWIGCWAFL